MSDEHFEVSQGIVETLFRRGGKRLHHFAANLFWELCTTFHQNRPSSVEDITKNILVSFFRTLSEQQSSSQTEVT